MTETIIPLGSQMAAKRWLEVPVKAARKALLGLLGRLEQGRLTLLEGAKRLEFGRKTEEFPFEGVITVRHPRFYSSVLLGGSVGAGEAYMSGWWSADRLTDVMRIVLRNRMVFEKVDRGWARLSAPLNRLYHLGRKNTPAGSRQNILAHYDLGNDFYRLFLDGTWTYSCGIFENADSTLSQASTAKYERICRKLRLQPQDHVVEIGTGWGGFVVHAAGKYGCRITSTTISEEQFELARQRVKAAGLEERVTLLRKDYREMHGRFDKLVSIEMIEAVGHHFLDAFFGTCSRLLKDNGVMALQAITIGDHLFERHTREVDFIKRYIFPGSCIPSVTAMLRSVAGRTDLRLFHLEDITPHYPVTLRHWRERFFENLQQIRALGLPEPFIRMWEFYLCYCEAGFAERYIGDVQMIFTKPLSRHEPILPPLAS
jgi:cyclopropane-fatty-acyl-phospholipid synthase